MAFLPYGYYDIVAGEESSTEWMPHLRFNWNRNASHSHNGVDSPQISIASVIKATTSLVSGDWVASGNTYKQTVTMPGAYLYTNTSIKFYIDKVADANNGSEVILTTKKILETQYEVYCMDNTIGLTVVYL